MDLMLFRFIILSLVIVVVMGCKSEKETIQEKPMVEQQTGLHYTVPAGWVSEQPKTKMRKAQYRLPGAKDGAGDAELNVFVFPGTGGTVEGNLQRWYAQFKQPDGSPTASKASIVNLEVNKLTVSVVYLTGTYLKSMSPMMMGGQTTEVPDYAMLAAIVETGTDPWFFKAVGPRQTIDSWRADFDKFVQTFEVN